MKAGGGRLRACDQWAEAVAGAEHAATCAHWLAAMAASLNRVESTHALARSTGPALTIVSARRGGRWGGLAAGGVRGGQVEARC